MDSLFIEGPTIVLIHVVVVVIEGVGITTAGYGSLATGNAASIQRVRAGTVVAWPTKRTWSELPCLNPTHPAFKSLIPTLETGRMSQASYKL